MKKKIIFFPFILGCVVFFAFSFAAFEKQLTGKVVKVSDGDTFTLLTSNKKQIRIRIYGIDAPETGQPYSEKSRLYLANMIAGRIVIIEVNNTDKYGRKVAKVKTETINDVGLEMIRAGFAWHYSYFDKTKAYSQVEQEARDKGVGLWADKNPINPYEYRKQKRK
jgi:endonuclease YncB( thermonuclease family)